MAYFILVQENLRTGGTAGVTFGSAHKCTLRMKTAARLLHRDEALHLVQVWEHKHRIVTTMFGAPSTTVK